MRPGDAPCHTDGADPLTFGDVLTFSHRDFRKMGIERIHAMPMIHHDQFAEKMKLISQGHPAGGA